MTDNSFILFQKDGLLSNIGELKDDYIRHVNFIEFNKKLKL